MKRSQLKYTHINPHTHTTECQRKTTEKHLPENVRWRRKTLKLIKSMGKWTAMKMQNKTVMKFSTIATQQEM